MGRILNELRQPDENVSYYRYPSSFYLEKKRITSDWKLFKIYDYDTQIFSSDFNQKEVVFTVYTDRGMEIAEEFEKHDTLKREVLVWDARKTSEKETEE